MTPTYAVPAGWSPRSASRKPLQLQNAYAFARSSTPPPDQWTHFAKLQPVSWKEVAIGLGPAALFLWALIAVLIQFGDELALALSIGAVLGAGVLYFGWHGIRALIAALGRNGWTHLHGVGLGSSGIVLRLPGADVNVPWEAVTGIRTMFVAAPDPKLANIPTLRIEYGTESADLATMALAVSPTVVYNALMYYWHNPASRDELGTTAQKRMKAWLTA